MIRLYNEYMFKQESIAFIQYHTLFHCTEKTLRSIQYATLSDTNLLTVNTFLFTKCLREAAESTVYYIQEVIRPANLWPLSIRRLFWTRPLRHWQRILICTFAYINGINPEVLIEWVLLLSLLNNEPGVRHIQRFFILVEIRRNNTLYSWIVSTRRYELMDGRPRTYLPRGERYKL